MSLTARRRLRRHGLEAVADVAELLARGEYDAAGEALESLAELHGHGQRASRALEDVRRRLADATEAAGALADGRPAPPTEGGSDPLSRALARAAERETALAALVTGLAAGEVAAIAPGDDGALSAAIDRLVLFMRKLGGVTAAIAEGDFSTPVWQASDSDVLGRNLVAMQAYLKDVSWAAERIASGDLTVAVVPRSERDLLGTAFSEMVEGLRHVVGNVTDAATTLAGSSERLASSGDETGAAVRELADAVAQVAGQVAGAGAAQNAAAISPADQDDVTDAIRRLGGRSLQIGGIVETITSIAGQTNLLALNAAIEAARAGEQGRGFAVVADEVRKLAEESKRSAVAIAELVKGIAGETQRVVELAEAEAARSDGRARAVTEARQGFEAIGGSVSEIATTSLALRTTAEELEALVKGFRLDPPGVPFRCALDADWTMETIGAGIDALTGYPAADFIGNRARTFASIIHPDDATNVDRVVVGAVKARRSYVVEYRVIDASGRVRRVLEHGRPVITRDDAVAWLDGVLFPA